MSARKGLIYYLNRQLEFARKKALELAEKLDESEKRELALEEKLKTIIHENNKLRKAKYGR